MQCSCPTHPPLGVYSPPTCYFPPPFSLSPPLFSLINSTLFFNFYFLFSSLPLLPFCFPFFSSQTLAASAFSSFLSDEPSCFTLMSPVLSEILRSGFMINSSLRRRTHLVQSFSVIFLYWFYVFS
ncbi:hypothetical protein VIGAN_03289900 [Vigna angularis var. angularis]|uniref:Uncharacterized protein n=1 Tax=Vigna angularis var. angularis TaxID=157739 RepID=A0A0S3RQH9_PHAAN|nr:hypothetical protein VIGAN_03289900 [Vigna angularis var. angularis]